MYIYEDKHSGRRLLDVTLCCMSASGAVIPRLSAARGCLGVQVAGEADTAACRQAEPGRPGQAT